MATCAGVQNVSRPIERCHEMSQWMPTMDEVLASTAHQMYQGTAATADDGKVEATGERDRGSDAACAIF